MHSFLKLGQLFVLSYYLENSVFLDLIISEWTYRCSRYWHDQASYVMAKSFEGLIPENSSLYEFPKDLLVPDVMFFVNGALNQNIHNETTAEKYAHNDLANKIATVYRRMRNPSLIEIGPPGLPKPMVWNILKVIDKIKYQFLPKPVHRPIWRS
ncbi:hypothetical protein J6590_057867 [Homalodisca vitripennis]|nr:hypothetical protein J6590_057867 [Homalodisca vitripennis]